MDSMPTEIGIAILVVVALFGGCILAAGLIFQARANARIGRAETRDGGPER